MRVALPLTFALSSLVCGCAHITTTERFVDEPLRFDERVSEVPESESYVAEASVDEAGMFTVKLSTARRCRRERVEIVRRTRIEERRPSTAVQVLEYIAAAGLLGGGAGVLVDVPNIPTDGDPLSTNPLGRTGAYGVAGSLIGLGVTALTFGIVDTIRGVDREDDLGEQQGRVDSSTQSIETCNASPAANQRLALSTTAGEIALGDTDAEGRLQVSISERVPRSLFFGQNAAPRGRLLVARTSVAEVDLGPLAALVEGEAWREVSTATSSRFVTEFLARFPTSPHRVEAILRRMIIRASTEIPAEFQDALIHEDEVRCTQLIDELRRMFPEDHGGRIAAMTAQRDRFVANRIDRRARIERECTNVCRRGTDIFNQHLRAWYANAGYPPGYSSTIDEMCENNATQQCLSYCFNARI